MKLRELHEAVTLNYDAEKWTVSGAGCYPKSQYITTLKGAPAYINGDFDCSRTLITSLVGAPKTLEGDFSADRTAITNLVGGPTKIGGRYSCDNNDYLTSLEGIAEHIGRSLSCANNKKLSSLHNIHKRIKFIGNLANFRGTPIISHALGLVLIDGLQQVNFTDPGLSRIINKYLDEHDVIACQDELIEAGYGAYAEL